MSQNFEILVGVSISWRGFCLSYLYHDVNKRVEKSWATEVSAEVLSSLISIPRRCIIKINWFILSWRYKRLEIHLLLSLWSELRCRLYFKFDIKNPTKLRHNFIFFNFAFKNFDSAWKLLVFHKKSFSNFLISLQEILSTFYDVEL